MAKVVEEITLTRQSISKEMKKFSDRGMVKIRKEGRTWLYSINEDLPLVKRIEIFDNSLIEIMVGPDEFDKIRLAHENHEQLSSPKESGYGTRKAAVRYGESKDKVPCVASRPGTYLKEKHTVIQ